MRLSRVAAAISWEYAIGEVLLIVVGITIALAANSWYESLVERREESRLLAQIRAALQADLVSLEEACDELQESQRELLSLHAFLNGSHLPSDEIPSLLIPVGRWLTVNTRTRSGPYEEWGVFPDFRQFSDDH